VEDDASPPRRVIGRILSLGFPMPGPLVDNYNFLSAPSFFDYDAIVVEPFALSQLIEDVASGEREANTFPGRPVRNEPREPQDESLAGVLLRRRDETGTALDNGAIILCFAHPAIIHRAVAGLDQLDDYYWLPQFEDIAFAPPLMLPAGGSRVHVVDFQHPLASFVSSQLANVLYRARFDVKALRSTTRPCVFALSEGGAAVGVEFSRDRGRIIFLPALARIPTGDDRYAMSDALQAGIRRALGVVAEGRPPPWIAAHPLPGLVERGQTRDEAKRSLKSAASALAEAEHLHDELARYQRLLWQESVGIEDVVLDALRLIGFDAYAAERTELTLRLGDTTVLLEIEASERPVDLAAHYRLRQRIERAIERTGQAPRGLLVVNGLRLQPPTERPQQVTDALHLAAETMRYSIATTTSLFEAVRAHLEGNEDAVRAYRDRLVSTDGMLD
jgi:hypothetical protein